MVPATTRVSSRGRGQGRGHGGGGLGLPRAHSVPASSSCPSRVVSDHCYPFSGHERNEAGPAPRCMMHSRAMGRGKRQATARCPNSYVHANDIYQVTPAYRLGSNVSLCLGKGAKAGELEGWPKAGASRLMDALLPTPSPSRRRIS